MTTVPGTTVETQVTQATTEVKASVEGQEAKVATKEPDYQKIIGLLQTENARLKANQASSPDIAAQLAAIQTEQRRTRRQLLELSDIDEPTRKTELAKLDTEEGQQRAQEEHTKRVERIGKRIVKNLEKAGLKTDHPKVVEANQRWMAARTIEEMEAIEDELTDFVLSEQDTRSKAEIAAANKKAQEAEQRFKVDNGALSPSSAPGTPGGAPLSLEQLSKVDTRLLTVKELREHEAAMDKAMGLGVSR